MLYPSTFWEQAIDWWLFCEAAVFLVAGSVNRACVHVCTCTPSTVEAQLRQWTGRRPAFPHWRRLDSCGALHVSRRLILWQFHKRKLSVRIKQHREKLLIFSLLSLTVLLMTEENIFKWNCQSPALSCDGVLIFMYLLVMSKSSQMSVFHSGGTIPPAISIQMGEHKQTWKGVFVMYELHTRHPRETSLWLERHNNQRQRGMERDLRKGSYHQHLEIHFQMLHRHGLCSLLSACQNPGASIIQR